MPARSRCRPLSWGKKGIGRAPVRRLLLLERRVATAVAMFPPVCFFQKALESLILTSADTSGVTLSHFRHLQDPVSLLSIHWTFVCVAFPESPPPQTHTSARSLEAPAAAAPALWRKSRLASVGIDPRRLSQPQHLPVFPNLSTFREDAVPRLTCASISVVNMSKKTWPSASVRP